MEWVLDKMASDNEAEVAIGSTLLPIILESSFRDDGDKDLAEAILGLTDPEPVESKKETPGGDNHDNQTPNQ